MFLRFRCLPEMMKTSRMQNRRIAFLLVFQSYVYYVSVKHFIRINRIEKLRCNNILLLLNKELINLIDNSINLGDVCSASKSIC